MSGLFGVAGAARADLESIRAIVGGERIRDLDGAEIRPGEIADVEAVLGASPNDELTQFPDLRWVHSGAAGVDGWLAPGKLRQSTILTSAAGNGAIPLAEHALMLMLMLSRDAPSWARAQTEHAWERRVHGELAGRTLGIIGYGNSGQDLADKALACHMDVLALRRHGTKAWDGHVRLVRGQEGLDELLTRSHMVVVTAPLTPATRGLIGAAQLARMPKGAAIIVISRGGIVDEDAVVSALRSGHLSGAGIDAHATEPLPADSELWDAPNAIITPHNAATTEGTARRGREIMLDNLERWIAGRQLRNVVDRAEGY